MDDLEEGLAFWVCRVCGTCQKGIGPIMVDDPHYNEHDDVAPRKGKDGRVIKGRISYGVIARRRYERPFYYRERIQQWFVLLLKIL